MGDKPKNEVPLSPLHLNMLQDVVDSSNIDDIEHEALLLHSYKRSFHGFAAMLTHQEAQKMAGTAKTVLFLCITITTDNQLIMYK